MKPRFKLADAKSMDLEEQWDLIKLLSVLQPIQTATVLLSAETSPPATASVCIPMIWGLLNNHLAVQERDLDTVQLFKADMS